MIANSPILKHLSGKNTFCINSLPIMIAIRSCNQHTMFAALESRKLKMKKGVYFRRGTKHNPLMLNKCGRNVRIVVQLFKIHHVKYEMGY